MNPLTKQFKAYVDSQSRPAKIFQLKKDIVKINTKIDGELDKFILENPGLVVYYEGLSRVGLIRKLMLGKMLKMQSKKP